MITAGGVGFGSDRGVPLKPPNPYLKFNKGHFGGKGTQYLSFYKMGKNIKYPQQNYKSGGMFNVFQLQTIPYV